jgi:predicted RNase H-like HicB family nuclease
MSYYPAIIHHDEGTAFGVSLPDFPGVIASGDTIEAAILDAEEALSASLEFMHGRGDEIPEATALERVAELEDAKDARAIVLVEARFAEPAVRVNTTLPRSLVARMDKEAERRGMSRSAFLAEGARALIRNA